MLDRAILKYVWNFGYRYSFMTLLQLVRIPLVGKNNLERVKVHQVETEDDFL